MSNEALADYQERQVNKQQVVKNSFEKLPVVDTTELDPEVFKGMGNHTIRIALERRLREQESGEETIVSHDSMI